MKAYVDLLNQNKALQYQLTKSLQNYDQKQALISRKPVSCLKKYDRKETKSHELSEGLKNFRNSISNYKNEDL